MTKTVAFFGDSFVGKYEGWVQTFCENYQYNCLHVGKPGADPLYVFEKWKLFNETYNNDVDICIYAHTEPTRLYHPDADMGITAGVVSHHPKFLSKLTDDNYEYLKAASSYFKHLVFGNVESLKSIIFPLGIDRYIEDNNRVFKKIIHLWSFAPVRTYKNDLKGWTAKSSWPFSMKTGMNIILDMTNLSASDPEYIVENKFDHRPLHFSLNYSWLVPEIIQTAIENYTEGGNLDFRSYVDEYSTWNNYIEAYNNIKKDLYSNG